MKRAALFSTLLFAAAGYVYLQTMPPAINLAARMPSGALLYLEAPDFARLLRDWDASKVKADWLQSANYAVFSRSNLFTKLHEVYGQYGEAAGLLPDLKGVMQIAGTDSALALYGIRDVEFLYITRIADADLIKSQLWAVRDKFEQRQAGGTSFYLRSDPASKRTVAFASAQGYLLVATRDDLVAGALELIAGGARPSIASDRWYREPVAAASAPGELRLVTNLESLVKNVYFRSYWVQRNASTVRQYWAGIADVKRSGTTVTENRVFLRAAEPAGGGNVSDLLALVPPEAGLYKAERGGEPSAVAALMVRKLIGQQPQGVRDWRDSPAAAAPDSVAGSEADLETRIDEQDLPADAGMAESIAAVRAMVENGGGRTLLLVQASSPVAGTFIQTPSVIVLEGARDWDGDMVRTALATAAGKLWTSAGLGAGWVNATSGQHAIERLDGLATLAFARRGHLLLMGNDARLLAAVLDRVGAPAASGTLTYAAGFRHLRENANYDRIMQALDFTSPVGGATDAPAFFSGNIASISRVLSGVAGVRVTEEEKNGATIQTVSYQIVQ